MGSNRGTCLRDGCPWQVCSSLEDSADNPLHKRLRILLVPFRQEMLEAVMERGEASADDDASLEKRQDYGAFSHVFRLQRP